MTDHKFEPFQKVLVRDEDGRAWNASFFSHIADDSDYKFMACGIFWKQCIPYTPETAHLLGTSQPYEPPVNRRVGGLEDTPASSRARKSVNRRVGGLEECPRPK